MGWHAGRQTGQRTGGQRKFHGDERPGREDVVSVVPFAHAGYAAYEVSQGEEYRYPMAADLAESL
jgi:hypothetical protein